MCKTFLTYPWLTLGLEAGVQDISYLSLAPSGTGAGAPDTLYEEY